MRTVSASSRDLAEHAIALNHLTRKRDGTVTLTANAASTTVTSLDTVVTEDSVIQLTPTTANAAVAKQTLFITPSRGSFLITHANNAQIDKIFRWIAAGD